MKAPKILPPLPPPAEISDLEEVAWEPNEIEAELLAAADDAAASGLTRARQLEQQAQQLMQQARAEQAAATVRYNGAVKQLAKARDVDPKRIAGHWWDPSSKVLRVKLNPPVASPSEEDKQAAAALAEAFGG